MFGSCKQVCGRQNSRAKYLVFEETAILEIKAAKPLYALSGALQVRKELTVDQALKRFGAKRQMEKTCNEAMK